MTCDKCKTVKDVKEYFLVDMPLYNLRLCPKCAETENVKPIPAGAYPKEGITIKDNEKHFTIHNNTNGIVYFSNEKKEVFVVNEERIYQLLDTIWQNIKDETK